jgi:hypothetical protein
MMTSNTTVLMQTPKCPVCEKSGFVEVSSEAYTERKRGALIREAFSELDKPLREQIISGTHPKCLESMTARLENK